MSDKVLLVTGGARGIGASVCRMAAEQGYAVAVNYRQNAEAAESLVADLRQQGANACALRADVSEPEQVQHLFQQLDQALGPLTHLVNNAGILAQQGRFMDFDLARWQRIFNTNVYGTVLCTQAAIERMSRERGGQGGAIVNVSSAAARIGAAFEYIDYAASKGAVDSMTLGLAKELAPEGIRVNAVRPGLIETDIHADGGEPGRVARLAAQVPMGRGGRAEEVAASILWLLGEQASYITGSLVDITGGR